MKKENKEDINILDFKLVLPNNHYSFFMRNFANKTLSEYYLGKDNLSIEEMSYILTEFFNDHLEYVKAYDQDGNLVRDGISHDEYGQVILLEQTKEEHYYNLFMEVNLLKENSEIERYKYEDNSKWNLELVLNNHKFYNSNDMLGVDADNDRLHFMLENFVTLLGRAINTHY